MNLITSYQTQNSCYKSAKPAKQVGILVHSTGANNPYLKRYVDNEEALGENVYGNHWNQPGIEKCMHAFVGKDKNGNLATVETLPYEYACWGCGNGQKGSFNYNPTAHIQFEICEDGLNDESYFNAAFHEAAEYCAYLCKKFGFSVNDIVSHKEAASQGYASNHGDCDFWLSKFGKDMGWFRGEVQKILNGGKKKMFEMVVNSVGVRVRTDLSFNGNRPTGKIITLAKPGQAVRILEFVDGIQPDGYQWIKSEFNGAVGYSQYDSQCYWIREVQ